MSKLTARNSCLLAYVKRVYNVPIFQRTSALLNTDGADAVVLFLLSLLRVEARAEYEVELRRLAFMKPKTSNASRVQCNDCGKKFRTSNPSAACPKCGTTDFEVL